MSRIDGSVYKFFEKILKADLLILDDFRLTHLEQQQRMDMLEIIEDRHAKKSNHNCKPAAGRKMVGHLWGFNSGRRVFRPYGAHFVEN